MKALMNAVAEWPCRETVTDCGEFALRVTEQWS